MLSLILSLSLSCPVTLKADVPVNLKPSATNSEFFCVDRQGAERIAIAYRENDSCHAQLKSATSRTDWSTVIMAVVGGLVLGYAAASVK